MVNWQPGASLDILRKRAELLAQLREFFAAKKILEVETPALANAPVTDLHIQSLISAIDFGQGKQTLYLQTSPEFAMKRLLAAYSESIYQIGKVFRHDPVSRQHNPEFTLLEWYRPGFTLEQLMAEVAELLCPLLRCESMPQISYRELFEKHLAINPHSIESKELADIAHGKIDLSMVELSDTDYLQLLMTNLIEPELPATCFVFDYPKGQASLSAIDYNDERDLVAKRFEVYYEGMELANGYYELVDAREQRARFEADNAARERLGLEVYPLDEKFLAAMEAGIPASAGVALGFDRLFMAIHGIKDIDQALTFSTPRA